MTTNNKNIYNFLMQYLEIANPQYAVLLSGHWGCGKTHFIKNWIQKFKENVKNTEHSLNPNTIDVDPIYVSLYGLKSIAELKNEINAQLHPLLNSKGVLLGKKILTIAGKIVFKTDLSADTDSDNIKPSISGTFEPLNLLKSDDESCVISSKLLVFDDIERSFIDVKQLLGFVNSFVEHFSCHVIIIGDTTKFKGSDSDSYNEFKEKTIGRCFQVEPDVDEAITSFLEDKKYWIRINHIMIENSFRCTKYNNLRILRQCINDLNTQFDGIEQSEEYNDLFVKRLVAISIFVYFEINTPKYKDCILNYFNPFVPSPISDLRNSLHSKYSTLMGKIGCSIFSHPFIGEVVDFVTKGKSLSGFIKGNINKKEQQNLANAFELCDYYSLSDPEFNRMYDDVVAFVDRERINFRELLNIDLGSIVNYFGYFDAKGWRSLSDVHFNMLKQVIYQRIEMHESHESLEDSQKNFLDGYSHFLLPNIKNMKGEMLRDYYREQTKQRIKALPNVLKESIDDLSDDSIEKLFSFDKYINPTTEKPYKKSCLFLDIDIPKLFNNIMKLSNKSRIRFCEFLSTHYSILNPIPGKANYFEDVKPLNELSNLIEDNKKYIHGIDELSFSRIQEVIGKIGLAYSTGEIL